MSATAELSVPSRLERRAGVSPTPIRQLIRDTPALVGAALLALFFLAALTAPWIAPGDPNRVDLTRRFTAPSMAHLLGTDNLGRDMLARLLYGSRLSLGMAMTATLGSSVIGLLLGVLAGVRGGHVDALIMRSADVLQALPDCCSRWPWWVCWARA